MLKDIFTETQTVKTPYIHFDGTTGEFEMKGFSEPENAVKYYQPLFNWIERYINDPAPVTHIKIQLDYFNSSSAKCILGMVKKLDTMFDKKNSKLIIDWIYDEDDEDTMEIGEVYQTIIKSTVNLISIKKP